MATVDMSVLALYKQRFRRVGTDLFIETYDKTTDANVDSFQLTNVPDSYPEHLVQSVAEQRLTFLVTGGGSGITRLQDATDYNSNLTTPLAAKADASATTASLATKQAAFVTPRTEGSTVTLVNADNAGTSSTPVACVVTVNTGLTPGFGRAFLGAGVVSFAGTASVLDKRVTGSANPSCSLVCIGTDTYWAVGGKA